MASTSQRLGLSLSSRSSLPTWFAKHVRLPPRWTVVAAAALAGTIVIAPVVWLRYWKHYFALRTISTFSIRTETSPPEQRDSADRDDSSNITDSRAGDAGYVIAQERVVSLPISVQQIKAEHHRKDSLSHSSTETQLLGEILDVDALINAYLRTTMSMFSMYTPQAYIMRLHPAVRRHSGDSSTAGEVARPGVAGEHEVAARDTFARSYLAQCDFVPGDRVCGVYVVEERREVRKGQDDIGVEVILGLSPPGGKDAWKDAPSGLLKLAVEEVFDDFEGQETTRKNTTNSVATRRIQFVNETVLWRASKEKPVFLETELGRWMHSLMAGWFVVGGSRAVMEQQEQ